MKCSKVISAIVINIILWCIPSANASLIGDEMTAIWSTNSGYVDTNTFVVGNNVELQGGWSLGNNLDVKTSQIVIDMTDSVGIACCVTWSFLDLDFSNTPGGISSVTVNTNYENWSDSFLTFNAHSITITNDRSVFYRPESDIFEINISVVPEPVSSSLFLTGITLLTVRHYIKRKKIA